MFTFEILKNFAIVGKNSSNFLPVTQYRLITCLIAEEKKVEEGQDIAESLKKYKEIIPTYKKILFLKERDPNAIIIKQVEEICEKEIIHTIQDSEPIGPKHLTDIMIIAPASGNTMAKLACDIIDTPALMAAKSHLRNELPLVIAPSTNNGLGAAAVNIGKLLNRRNYYFVPFRQDNPITKPRSIVFDSEYIIKTIEYALDGEQISPILI